MASFARVTFSDENLDLAEISQHHNDIDASVRSYFLPSSSSASVRFAGYSSQEIELEMVALLLQHERNTSLNILAALEAAFRVDFLQRCYRKRKDKLSKALRHMHSEKGSRVSLEDDILQAWKDYTSVSAQIISDIRGAFKYRHWLAHGRYWEPKLGQKYDYHGLYILAETIFENFPLEGVSV